MDVVEVSPPYDHGEITALAGAQIATEMLCLLAEQRGRQSNGPTVRPGVGANVHVGT
jgi:hypothetical protein